MFRLTPTVKNLLLITIAVYLAQKMVSSFDVTGLLSLWGFGSERFRPYQFFTYMFAHGDFRHILFNMLGLVFLGPMLEGFWGPKKFLTFYIVTGLGAGVLYAGIKYYSDYQLKQEISIYMSNPDPGMFSKLVNDNLSAGNRRTLQEFIDGYGRDPENESYISQSKSYLKDILELHTQRSPMLGASGAIYGILMAFGLLFPNTELMLIFPPIPIKAKYMALGLGGIAIYNSFIDNPDDNVAHIAHLGGMVFAFIMIKLWQKQRDSFY